MVASIAAPPTAALPAAAGAKEPLLVLVLGPTGSGKSSLAVALAQRFQGEILSCDSVAVYREMEIGAAKPTPAQRAQVPHHLLDMLPPTAAMTAGDWARAARAAAVDIAGRGRLPIVAGGTGLYLRAFTTGLDPLPPRCPELRARLSSASAARAPGHLHRLLMRLSPTAAAKIHPRDTPKLIRALEIALLTRSRQPAGGAEPLHGFRLLRIGLDPPRADLYARLNARADQMLQAGLVEETRQLQQVFGAEAQALGALGYREAAAVLTGRLTLEQARSAIQQGHRNYAKRQMTWFRREPEVHWLPGFGDDVETGEAAGALVAKGLVAETLTEREA